MKVCLGGRWIDGRERFGETEEFGGKMERGVGLRLWRRLRNNLLFFPESQRMYNNRYSSFVHEI